MKKVIKSALLIIAGVIIFVGLPLVGWGISNIGNFLNNPARLIYFVAIILLQFFTVIYNPKTAKIKEKHKKGIRESKFDLLLIQIFSLTIVLLAPFSDSHSIGG